MVHGHFQLDNHLGTFDVGEAYVDIDESSGHIRIISEPLPGNIEQVRGESSVIVDSLFDGQVAYVMNVQNVTVINEFAMEVNGVLV